MTNKNVKISKKMPLNKDSVNLGKLTQDNFPIVGIGSSAGGLDAIQKFFRNSSQLSGIAYIIISHLDPKQVSILPELIQKCTKMKVIPIVKNTKVQPDCVYVMSPNTDIIITNRTLNVTDPIQLRGRSLPIDEFFKSLAKDIESNAIGIIFSGTGSDGTIGMRKIKAEGGTTIVQEPSSASYEGMPKSVIDAEIADYILTPEQMPAELSKIATSIQSGGTVESDNLNSKILPGISAICTLIKNKTKHDFFQYKRNTLCRRIENRMNHLHLDGVFAYLKYLEENEKEVDLLVKELLIRVTNFFRDEVAFDTLKKHLIKILKDKPNKYLVRVWVAGCSTGEEVYTLSIILTECIDELKKDMDFQIFGTDIDEGAIDIARKGVYPERIAKDVNPERLSLFFHKEESGYMVKKDLRNKVIFAVHNIISDPPFTKLDLVSCRNVFIYMESGLQAKVMPVFHFSLKNEGILFLGTSESIGPNDDLFLALDTKWKIFQRKKLSLRKFQVRFPIVPAEKKLSKDLDSKEIKPEQVKMNRILQRYFMKEYTPATIIINKEKNIVYNYGKIASYLKNPSEKLNSNILDIVIPRLKAHLNSAIIKSEFQNKQVVIYNLALTEANKTTINLKVTPFKLDVSAEKFFIITFEDNVVKADKKIKEANEPKTKGTRIQQLESEVQILKEELQSSIAQLQTANEEHLSSTEELQSMNEEMQSANEELETTKEEQQSMNEELITTNTELESKLSELSHLNDDMKNLLNSTEIATLFLDSHQNIRGFTPKIAKIINLINTDIGRPISDIVHNLEYKNLLNDAEVVLSTLVEKQKKVKSIDNKYYLVRILPYRTSENVIDGVVITFVDMTEQTKAEKIIETANNYAKEILSAIDEPVVILDQDLLVLLANKSFYSMFDLSEKEIVGKKWQEMGAEEWNKPALIKLLKDIITEKSSIVSSNISQKIGNKKVIVQVNARKINPIMKSIRLEGHTKESDKNQIIVTFHIKAEN